MTATEFLAQLVEQYTTALDADALTRVTLVDDQNWSQLYGALEESGAKYVRRDGDLYDVWLVPTAWTEIDRLRIDEDLIRDIYSFDGGRIDLLLPDGRIVVSGGGRGAIVIDPNPNTAAFVMRDLWGDTAGKRD